MSQETQPFFIVSSGRSGTAMLHKALSAAGDIEMHHEYMVHITQKLAVRRYMGLADGTEVGEALASTHGAAVRYSEAAHWGDSSNKLSWLIPDIAPLLPRAKFVHLIRDGRKVASSYFHKLGDECYDDRSTSIFQEYYDNPRYVPMPPPEKKYWWPLPRHSDPRAAAFRKFDRFERIAWHWAEINREISRALAALAPERSIFLRLEDLRESEAAARALYDFLNLPYRKENFSMFERPHNVNRPEDRLLDETQRFRFDAIAGGAMESFGYASRAEYVVNY